MSSKPTSDPLDRRYLILAAVGVVLIGFIAWFAFDGIRQPQGNLPPDPDPSTGQLPVGKIDLMPDPVAPSPPDRPLELNLPALGTVKGAKWIRSVSIIKEDGNSLPPLDLLVDGQSQLLAARLGNEAFASHPAMDVYWRVLKQQTSVSEGLNKKVKSVRHLPLPWPSREAEAGIIRAYGGWQFAKPEIETWVPLAIEFQDDANLHATMLSVSTDGRIFEGRLHPKVHNEDGLSPYKHLYKPPVVAGASRFATMVKITTGSIPGLPAPYVEYNPVGFQGVFFTEPWASDSPWLDEQIDPVYGDRLPDEYYVPDDNAVGYNFLDSSKYIAYGYYQKKDGTVGVPIREEAEARYQARLAREAAEKGK